MRNTIKSNAEIDRLFANGRFYRGHSVSARACKTPDERGQNGRVVFIAGKRLGNAVFRNRCRRVMREMYYRAGGPWAGIDIAFMATRATPNASVEQLDKDCASIIKRLQSDMRVYDTNNAIDEDVAISSSYPGE